MCKSRSLPSFLPGQVGLTVRLFLTIHVKIVVRYANFIKLCNDCIELNKTMLTQWSNLDIAGSIAIVTGARIKIGYQIALRLLRSNATVIATTRFPHDAARKFSEEKDYHDWSDRLRIINEYT